MKARLRRTRDFFFIVAPDKASIYPERLSSHRWQYDAFEQQRIELQSVFQSIEYPQLIDAWTPMKSEKEATDDLLYARTDTHYTHLGALTFAKTLIDGIRPGLWDDQAVVSTPGRPSTRDLTILAGLPDLEEPWTSFRVARPGVEMRTCRRENRVVDCNSVLSVSHTPLRIQSQADPLIPMIEGKTLLVHDSFVESFLKPTLWPYFLDISFVKHELLKSGDLAFALAHYDQVVIERVEREIGGAVHQMQQKANSEQLWVRLGLEGGG